MLHNGTVDRLPGRSQNRGYRCPLTPCRVPLARPAGGKDLTERTDLLGGDAQPVGVLDQDLLHHVRTVEAGVRGQPGGGVVSLLVLVHLTIDRDEVGRVVRELQGQRGRPLRRTLAPGVRQCHHVVDLHGSAGLRAAAELDQVTGVRVGQGAADHHARYDRVEVDVGEPAAQHVVAGVAAVAVHVRPRRSEEVPVVVSQRERGPNGERGQCRPGALQVTRRYRPRWRLPHMLPPPGQQQRYGKHEHGGHRPGHQETGRRTDRHRTSLSVCPHQCYQARGGLWTGGRRRSSSYPQAGWTTGDFSWTERVRRG